MHVCVSLYEPALARGPLIYTMKLKFVFAALVVCAYVGSAFAQSVVITPKRTVYTRPRPLMDFKKTFVVRRPIATAATPALSQKITAAISPESVLSLELKDEMGEYQWVEEADYKVLYNGDGVLSISLWMEGTAAYPDSVTKYAVVDLKTGRRVGAADVFQNLPYLAAMIRSAQVAEVSSAIEEMKKDPENKDIDPAELFAETNFKAEDIKEFSIDEQGVTFYYDYGFPHVIEALQPPGEFRFGWGQVRPFIKPNGLLARFIG